MMRLFIRSTLTVFCIVLYVCGQELPLASTCSAAELEQRVLVNGVSTEPLRALLAKCGILYDGSLRDLVVQTQQRWLRQRGLERTQVEDVLRAQKDEYLPFFVKLGLVGSCSPSKQEYHYCLVHGSTVEDICKRIAYVITLWKRGVRFQHIVLLTGERDLDQDEWQSDGLSDEMQKYLGITYGVLMPAAQDCATEVEAMKILYAHAQLPVELRKIPLTVVHAAKQQTPDGALRRPNTYDTIVAWLTQNPPVGACLAISHQPFVGYQHSVMRTLLATKGFDVETVGPELDLKDFSVVLCLDTLARLIYQEQIRLSAA